MNHINYRFSNAATDVYFESEFADLTRLLDKENCIIITDENLDATHGKRFKDWNTIVLKAGEEYKVQATADAVIDQLIDFGADRSTTLVGVGGGVVTDLTGYIASIYMRGLRFGFVPTSVLAMVDACIGGKNGIDVGVYKNMVGVIRQPSFILYDLSFLESLPRPQWENGFAEIIKHACIRDAAMFKQLEKHTITAYRSSKKDLAGLIKRNAELKIKLVQADEFEKNDRRLLNYGHTLGHAIENHYELLHGQAIAIGMAYAAVISGEITAFKEAERVIALLLKYNLPTFVDFDREKVLSTMRMDKKRLRNEMNYVLLEKIGKATVVPIGIHKLEKIINELQ